MKENINLIITVILIFIISMVSWCIGYNMGTNKAIEHYNNGDVPTKLMDKILENLKKNRTPKVKNKKQNIVI